MSGSSLVYIRDQIQAIREEILKAGATPLRFKVSDKLIDNSGHLRDLLKQLAYWEAELTAEQGQCPLQGPDLEVF